MTDEELIQHWAKVSIKRRQLHELMKPIWVLDPRDKLTAEQNDLNNEYGKVVLDYRKTKAEMEIRKLGSFK